MLQAPPPTPSPTPVPGSTVIVKLIEPPHDPTGLSDVLIGSIGLTGAIVLLALVVGLAFGGLLFVSRWRRGL